MILVVVTKRNAFFFCFSQFLAFFCFFSLELSYKKEGKSRGESKERVLDVT